MSKQTFWNPSKEAQERFEKEHADLQRFLEGNPRWADALYGDDDYDFDTQEAYEERALMHAYTEIAEQMRSLPVEEAVQRDRGCRR
jgi:hypothetical protein